MIRRLWSGDRGLEHDGEHYRLDGVHSGPVPPHDIGIWVGAYGPRMMDVIGRHADGWLQSSPYLPPDELSQKHAAIDEGAEAAGRDPGRILRIYNVQGRIIDGPTEEWLVGDQDHWLEELGALHHDKRMDGFVLWPDDEDREGQARAFAEVAAQLRADVT